MTVDRNELKALVRREIEQSLTTLTALSDWMYHNPELGLQEHQASQRISDIIAEYGASVTKGVSGMPTAFVATLPGGNPGPRMAIIAEYDALPEVGHGCGHNIIATAALGAAMGLAKVGHRLPGQVVLMGTPAEESAVPNAGGKIHMME